MSKIKVIDLLNIISNGEEVPKKIKWQDTEYEYDSGCKNYVNDYEDLLSVIDGTNYSDEIEIIHKNKEIKKLPYYSLEKIQKAKNKEEHYKRRIELIEKRVEDYHNKINEIIDCLMEDK